MRLLLAFVLVTLVLDVTTAHAGPARTVFLNRCPGGCAVEPGSHSARKDRSKLVDETARIAESRVSGQEWADLVACVQANFAAYDVEITGADPGRSEKHIEVIVAGDPTDIGRRRNSAKGLAPRVCSPLEDGIVFVFADAVDSWSLCDVTTHEIGHAFGLEHVAECDDVMSGCNGIERVPFADRDLACSDSGVPREQCLCGGATQNAHRTLLAALGPADACAADDSCSASAPDADLYVGEVCSTDAECGGGRCVDHEGASMCTTSCFLMPEGDSCPADSYCANAMETAAFCAPGAGPDEGCSAGGAPGPGIALVTLVVFAARRRSRGPRRRR